MTDGKLVYDIRKQMWAMYHKNRGSIQGVTQLINHFSEALADAIEMGKNSQAALDEIENQLNKLAELHNLQ